MENNMSLLGEANPNLSTTLRSASADAWTQAVNGSGAAPADPGNPPPPVAAQRAESAPQEPKPTQPGGIQHNPPAGQDQPEPKPTTAQNTEQKTQPQQPDVSDIVREYENRRQQHTGGIAPDAWGTSQRERDIRQYYEGLPKDKRGEKALAELAWSHDRYIDQLHQNEKRATEIALQVVPQFDKKAIEDAVRQNFRAANPEALPDEIEAHVRRETAEHYLEYQDRYQPEIERLTKRHSDLAEKIKRAEQREAERQQARHAAISEALGSFNQPLVMQTAYSMDFQTKRENDPESVARAALDATKRGIVEYLLADQSWYEHLTQNFERYTGRTRTLDPSTANAAPPQQPKPVSDNRGGGSQGMFPNQRQHTLAEDIQQYGRSAFPR